MKTSKTLRLLYVCLFLVLILSACGAEETPIPEPIESIGVDHVIAEGRILPARNSFLNFSVPGRVAEILISEGDTVTKGQPLIILADQERAQASVQSAELGINHGATGP